jgi:hypothetical protein
MIELSPQAFELESRYRDNMRLLYRIHARRARLIGLWAAEKMFLFSEKADEYALNMVVIDHQNSGGQGMWQKIQADFKKNEIPAQEQDFKILYSQLLLTAADMVLQEQDIYA